MITINRKTYFFKNNMIFIVVLKGQVPSNKHSLKAPSIEIPDSESILKEIKTNNDFHG